VKSRIAAAITAGLASGSAIEKNVRNRSAPSTRAAGHPVAQADAGPRSHLGKPATRATGRLGHEGTSSDLANYDLTKPQDTSPRLILPTVAVLSERDQRLSQAD
jgi:hypothetical protein